MQLNCQTDILRGAVNLAAKAAASKSSVPALEGVLLSAQGRTLTVTGYNLRTGIQTAVPLDTDADGSAVLPSKLLCFAAAGLPESETATVTFDDATACLSCGESRYILPAMPAEDYPELPRESETDCAFQIKSDELRTLVKNVAFCTAKTDARPVYTGALFDVSCGILTAVSVDGYRMALRRASVEPYDAACSFVVPRDALNEIDKLCNADSVSVSVCGPMVFFHAGDTVLFFRQLDGDFIDYDNMIDRESGKAVRSVTVDAGQLADCVKRIALRESSTHPSLLKCVFSRYEVALSVVTSAGAAYSVCPLECDGELDLTIGFNPGYFLDAVQHIDGQARLLLGSRAIDSALLMPLDGNDFVYLICPVNMSSYRKGFPHD